LSITAHGSVVEEPQRTQSRPLIGRGMPRRRPQRGVGLRPRASARNDESDDPRVLDARRPALRGPTGAHRSNVLWFNKKLLAQAGVTPPSRGYTVPQFLADLAKLKACGAVPLCFGGKDRFTQEGFHNAVSSYARTKDAEALANTLEKRRLPGQDPPAQMRPDHRRARGSSGCGRPRRRLGDCGCASTGSRGGARGGDPRRPGGDTRGPPLEWG
jgi:hypothetical protein